jgi:hypothetical protein
MSIAVPPGPPAPAMVSQTVRTKEFGAPPVLSARATVPKCTVGRTRTSKSRSSAGHTPARSSEDFPAPDGA